MPQIGLRHKFELTTRSSYTKVNAEMGISLDGRELPNTAVIGEALDAALELFQEKITEFYKGSKDGTKAAVPERHGDTPVQTPTF